MGKSTRVKSKIGDLETDTIVGTNQKVMCHPCSFWARGLNGYANGLIREYISKGTSFENITPEYIQK